MKSRVVIGTEVYSSNWGVHFSPDDVRQIIEKGLQHNVTDIDTAASYGDNHFVEELLGNAIQDLRSQVKLHSKFGINQCSSGKGGPISSISEIIKNSEKKIKEIDEKEIFKSDDEIGWFFNELKKIQNILSQYKN